MKQFKTFHKPVYKGDASGDLIEVGDTVTLVLRDNSEDDVTVVTVEKGARRIGWDLDANGIPRTEDVIAVGGEHQFPCPEEEDPEYASLHDGPEDDGNWEPVVNPNAAPMQATQVPHLSGVSKAQPKKAAKKAAKKSKGK